MKPGEAAAQGKGRRISAEPELRPQRSASGGQPAKRTKNHRSSATSGQIDWAALMLAFERSGNSRKGKEGNIRTDFVGGQRKHSGVLLTQPGTFSSKY